jgi:NADPH:quinone reductase-like Zn-dependent oxidoreductase
VLVLGATGSAGQLAVQVARHLGASRIVAAGRDQATLGALDADTIVSLAGDLPEAAARVGEAAAEVDVVIDYLWGPPAEAVIPALLHRRDDRDRRLAWVQVGAITGPELTIRSELLRGANLWLCGSGQGSVSTRGILEELPALAAQVSSFTLNVDARPMSSVETVWGEERTGRSRVVFTN